MFSKIIYLETLYYPFIFVNIIYVTIFSFVLYSNLPIQLILLDLSAAFDTIDFDILIERLRSIGIGKVPIKWFSNFIRGRSFSIKINETLCY